MNTLVFLLFLFGSCCGNQRDLLIIDSIKTEQPCLSEGGTCTITADCPAGQLAKRQGLCPKQRNRGVECCYGQSVKETRCQKKGGVCFQSTEYCNSFLVFREATDCPEDQFCCIMVA